MDTRNNQQHSKSEIKKTNSISSVLSNLRQGDHVFLDIDDTLMLTGFDKTMDNLPLTENALPAIIKQLRESGVKVIALTERKEQLAAKTIQQIQQHGIEFDEIIHAPSKKTPSTKQSTKGEAISNYLKRPEHGSRVPKRIIMIDHQDLNLTAIEASLQDTIPCLLYHYQYPQQLFSENETLFPATLDDYTTAISLGGGTESTYQIKTTDGKSLVLKLGAHPDQIKMEILCNRLYQAMGVNVPQQAVYNTLPAHLANQIKQSSLYGTYQVSEFVPEDTTTYNEQQRHNLIRNTASKQFVAHALLGNIDAAKPCNYVVNRNGEAILIDAGANYLYRAKGNNRKQELSSVTELKTMRDPAKNTTGHEWFGHLSNDDIQKQLIDIAKKSDELERILWETANKLEFSDALRLTIIQAFGDRLDQLITCYAGSELICHPKQDKAAVEGHTSAGILTYTMKEGQPFILLAKRVKHKWYDCFGGKSDAADGRLVATACREVTEESSGQLNYTQQTLHFSPFHDQISINANHHENTVYRMYIAQHSYIDPANFTDNEHSDYTWLPLSTLVKAITDPEFTIEEGKKTITIRLPSNNQIILFPPFYQILQQAPVLNNLKRLSAGKPMNHTHTQSTTNNSWKAEEKRIQSHSSPDERARKIASTLMQHANVLSTLKQKSTTNTPPSQVTTTALSPSEIHFKVVLGAAYKVNDSHANVSRMLERTCPRLIDTEKERLIAGLVPLVENERQHPTDIYLYHACDTKVAFTYAIYTALYSRLSLTQTQTFRAKFKIFEQFKNINDFIAHYSNNGSKPINNDDSGYHEAAISTNPFLFGNHTTETSFSISYLINDSTRRNIQLEPLLQDVFGELATDALINQLTKLYKIFEDVKGSAIYQIRIPHEQIQAAAYPAGFLGAIKPLNNNMHLGEIIDTLRQRVSSNNVTEDVSKYIQSLQARYYACPRQRFETKCFYFKQEASRLANTEDTKQQIALDQEIDQCIAEIVHMTLANITEQLSLDKKASLLTIREKAFAQNDLPIISNTLKDELATAINTNNTEIIKQILTEYPDLKNQSISSNAKTAYLKCDSSSQNTTSNKPLELIIRNINPPDPDLLVTIFGNTWHQLLEPTNDFDFILATFRWASVDTCLTLAKKYKNSITNAVQLHKIIVCLQRNDRLDFAIEYKSIIKNSYEIRDIISCLPTSEARLRFAITCKAIVRNILELNIIIPFLDSSRLAFAIECKDIFSDIDQLVTFLQELPQEQRYSLAIECKDKITSYIQLIRVFKQLSSEHRLSFAVKCKDKIANGLQLFIVLSELPQEQRYSLAIECKDKITDDIQLSKVLSTLPSEFIRSFALKCEDKIGSNTLSILNSSELPRTSCAEATLFKPERSTHQSTGSIPQASTPLTQMATFTP